MISKNRKAKSKTTPKRTAKKKSQATPEPETNPAQVRKEVSKLVEAGAAEMAKAVIEEALKGQLAPTKYLFEVASIYPPQTDGSQATSEEDCLAKILLDKLKLATKPAEEKDAAEIGSGNPAADATPAENNAARACSFDTPGARAERAEGMEEAAVAEDGDDSADDKLRWEKTKAVGAASVTAEAPVG